MIAAGCSIGDVIQQPTDRAADWRPQAFGRGRRPRIVDPLIEPLWIGERVLIHHRGGTRPAGTLGDGTPVEGWAAGAEEVAGILDALAQAVRGSSAVIDGYLTRQASQPSEGRAVGLDAPERASMTRRLLLGDSQARQDAERRERVKKAAESFAAEGYPLVFVAVDLLELDGEAFLEVPLLERKRHLGTIVVESELVRVSPFVRAPAERWYPTWRAAGFFELALKAANSRYRPGEPNDEWAISPIPRR